MASSKLARLLRWCRVSRDGDDTGDFPIQQVTYLGKVGNAVIWLPYGVHANIPNTIKDGIQSLALMLSMRGNAEERVALPGSPQVRPTLEPGELAIYHPPTNSMIHFKADGDIEVTAAGLRVIADSVTFSPNAGGTTSVTVTGDLTVTGDTALGAAVTSNGVDISDTHTHTGSPTAPNGVQSNTGVPV